MELSNNDKYNIITKDLEEVIGEDNIKSILEDRDSSK